MYDECIICADDTYRPVILINCGHTFCEKCVNVHQFTRCPICKEQIKDSVVNYILVKDHHKTYIDKSNSYDIESNLKSISKKNNSLDSDNKPYITIFKIVIIVVAIVLFMTYIMSNNYVCHLNDQCKFINCTDIYNTDDLYYFNYTLEGVDTSCLITKQYMSDNLNDTYSYLSKCRNKAIISCR